MNSFVTFLLLSVSVALLTQAVLAAPPKPYGGGYGGAVPALPPFGVAAKHPRYGYGSSYGGSYGNNDYVTVLRYENQKRDNYGVESSYAYDVVGQKVQVARLDKQNSYY